MASSTVYLSPTSLSYSVTAGTARFVCRHLHSCWAEEEQKEYVAVCVVGSILWRWYWLLLPHCCTLYSARRRVRVNQNKGRKTVAVNREKKETRNEWRSLFCFLLCHSSSTHMLMRNSNFFKTVVGRCKLTNTAANTAIGSISLVRSTLSSRSSETRRWVSNVPRNTGAAMRSGIPASGRSSDSTELWMEPMPHSPSQEEGGRDTEFWLKTSVAAALVIYAACWALVPLYAVFCQATGLGGTTQQKRYAPPPESTCQYACMSARIRSLPPCCVSLPPCCCSCVSLPSLFVNQQLRHPNDWSVLTSRGQ